MYGDYHHQPQNHCRYDELDPCLVVREPSMHPVHGQPPSRLPRSPNPNTLSHLWFDDGAARGRVLFSQLAAGPILLVGLALEPLASSKRPGVFLFRHTVAWGEG
jgi:hypothetical protein